MTSKACDSFKCKSELKVGDKKYSYMSFDAAAKNGLSDPAKLPRSLKVLLENLLRYEDDTSVTKADILATTQWLDKQSSTHEIAFRPARVLMQDFTGVPAVVDLATMRDAMGDSGGDPERINPLSPVDLVIDHSVTVDFSGTPDSFHKNVEMEFERNKERYEFLRWAQTAFNNLRVVPPGTGICHQVNLEYLAKTVWTSEKDGQTWAYPDTIVGTDSHTTMINGLSVLGWGVGGIEAEAAMLSQPVTMTLPDVIGFKLTGKLVEGVTATDLVLTVVEMLRKKGVVGKFVEFYGSGLDHLPLADRATIANMAPEYGATCGFFPIDSETIKYLSFTGRDPHSVALTEAYAKAQGLWRTNDDPLFTDTVVLDMGTVVPSIAGPKRPQDRIVLSKAASAFLEDLPKTFKVDSSSKPSQVSGKDFSIDHGSVVIAAITSCTNTSNPSVLFAAGLLARKANLLGLKTKPWVKPSLAPGSQVVTAYLEAAGLQKDLDALGFNLVGYGCTTCIGNSGPLDSEISKTIQSQNLVAAAVLSGNRNFEGRINPDVKANYLASPPLVVAYALAGSMKVDITKDSLGKGKNGADVYLKDIWPSNAEIQAALHQSLKSEMFTEKYSNVFTGPTDWQKIQPPKSKRFNWDPKSTYVKKPPFFDQLPENPKATPDIISARTLALLGDSVTTDHISPAGSIKSDSPAGLYLKKHGIEKAEFNSYGARRGNHEVMMRGTFANIRIRNEMLDGVEGGFTKHIPSGKQMSIFDAAMTYEKEKIPLVVVAGKEYGTGSSRDWAAKGTLLLGVKAVICESFERIHRSNLIGMGVLPLEFADGATRKTLGLKGNEEWTLTGLDELQPKCQVKSQIKFPDGKVKSLLLLCRIDTEDELTYFQNSGILHYVLRQLKKSK